MSTLFKAFLGLCCLLSAATAEEPQAKISDLAWLEGCWRGSAFNGVGAECWVQGTDGHMTGLFQLVQNGELSFTEIMHLADFEDGPALRVKHFHPDITGWEEKGDFISFSLQSADDQGAVFSGLTFAREGDNRLVLELRMKSGEGETYTETMVFDRID